MLLNFLRLMIEFTEDTSIYEWYGYVYASSMYLVAVIQAIFLNQYFHRCMTVGMNIRTSVISMVYKKVKFFKIRFRTAAVDGLLYCTVLKINHVEILQYNGFLS